MKTEQVLQALHKMAQQTANAPQITKKPTNPSK